MSRSQQNSILFEILRDMRGKKLTVTGVRNEILKRDGELQLDKATLRRWVNSRFVTLTKQGVLSRHSGGAANKAFFGVRNLPGEGKDNESSPVSQPLLTKIQQSLGTLKEELNVCILKAKTQASVIKELKRIHHDHPELQQRVAQDIDDAVDENCQILGKIKALENLLDRGGAIF